MAKKKSKQVKEYSAELTSLLKSLKMSHPTYIENLQSRELNKEELKIYTAALEKKGMEDRRKRFRSFDKNIHKKI